MMRPILLALLLSAPFTVTYAEDNKQTLTQGFDHAALTVLNLDKSTRFFIEVLGWEQKGKDPNYPASFLSDGKMFLSLWQVKNPEKARAFDHENQPGLNHIAFKLDSYAALDDLYAKLLEVEDIIIESAPKMASSGPKNKKHMFIREPGGIRLEFAHTPGREN